jgi:AAA+ ATPase superfamily predicted ATPase
MELIGQLIRKFLANCLDLSYAFLMRTELGKKEFVGRKEELSKLDEFAHLSTAAIAVVYGRRRVGKTTLIEKAFAEKKMIKIEGIEGKPLSDQLSSAMIQLRNQVENSLLGSIFPKTWHEFFDLVAKLTTTGEWIIYLEELQWLANYQPDLIAELKLVWDNDFRRNRRLKLILCGSAPSFFLTHVIRSKALYNRTSLELHVEPLPLCDAHQLLPKTSMRSFFDAYLTVGGIPVYLERLHRKSSVFLSLSESSFTKDAYFLNEYAKVFISSFGANPTYRTIIETIASRGICSRSELLKACEAQSGGSITRFLVDLESCGFITRVTPLQRDPKSRLSLYQIADNYLHFYFSFIQPIKHKIATGAFQKAPNKALDMKRYAVWLGFAFERFCRNQAHAIAELLGFSAVQYDAGGYYTRATLAKNNGVQIDLLFQRADKVLTICEVKYTEAPVGAEVITELEQKIKSVDFPARYSLERVLISASGISKELHERHYFDRIITLEDLYRSL